MSSRLLFAGFLLVACGDNNMQMSNAACAVDTDCPASGNECITEHCQDGQCLTTNAPTGTPVTHQTPMDCRKNVCDGAGNIVSDADDTDTPAAIDCLDVACANGVETHTPQAIGTACGSGLMCDGGGDCVTCTLPSQCPGTDTGCSKRSCLNGVCGIDIAPMNAVSTTQVAGDCQKLLCDGSGGSTPTIDNTDLPKDNNACTSDLCTNGVPSNPDLPSGTACGTGMTCDGNGNCM
jgi:hypothetical protein